MGCCLSKTDPISPPLNLNPRTAPVEEKMSQGEEKSAMEVKNNNSNNKKEVFVIQHRKSHDNKHPDHPSSGVTAAEAVGVGVRTSSCTKEEVDAILIQCGRLSRSSSGKLGNNSNNNGGKKYSGSKRSFDLEGESTEVIISGGIGGEVNESSNISSNSNNSTGGDDDERLRRRPQSRGSHRRRSTPSRSRERSGSREREGGGVSSRRVSRSPGKRRSEGPIPISNPNPNPNPNNVSSKPVKLVSVPPTVSSLSVEKVNNGGGEVKRVLVKRNVGSPRSQSPARGNENVNANSNSNQASLSRNGSRKTEKSPYRRTPLNEIDMNSLPFQPLSNKRHITKGKEIEEDGVVSVKLPVTSASQNKQNETHNNTKGGGAQVSHRRTRSRGAEGFEVTKTNYCRVNEVQTLNPENLTEPKTEVMNPTEYDALVTPVIVSGCSDNLTLPQTLMRSRSSRKSRDFDVKIDVLTTPAPVSDYNSLLLQDIQKFHQKSNTNTNTNFSNTPLSVPQCVTKANSIVEAVADLNSSTGDKFRLSPREIDSKNGSNFPFVVESEVNVGDDLVEPSLHKYVTMRKTRGDRDGEEESSGSNSITIGGDSTDCWTSKSYTSTREDGFQKTGISECEKKLSKKGPMPGSYSKATVASM